MELSTYKVGHFPEGLLKASDAEKKEYFKNCIVPHKNLDEAISETLRHIYSCVDERIILVCAPSGAGKNVLIKDVSRKIIEAEDNNPNKNPGCIPVVAVEAMAVKDGSFDFNGLMMNILEEMSESMSKSKVNYEDVEALDSKGNKITMFNVKKADYAKVVINTLKFRYSKALIINEAHHMLLVASDKKANWSVSLLKSLASSHTPIVLVGTYELLKYLELESEFLDQIIRRTKIVNFPRYYKNACDFEHFGSVAMELVLHMPFEEIDQNVISENLEYLFDSSLGCVGLLKLWLMDAYAYALANNAKFLTKKHLDATKTSGYQSKIVQKGIEDGEERLATILSDREPDNYSNSPVKNKDKTSVKSNAKKNAPFKRKPKRDAAYTGFIKNNSNRGKNNDDKPVV